ncbi:MAG TPA: DUF1996 domain-containing protein [Gaiellaceae bacterium]|jgi:hypothetical protein|nr:DUF1996 domain-containing protein [Gaiellaceae bacterium]
MRRLVGLCLCSLAITVSAASATATAAAPSGAFFFLTCTVSHSAPDDPIVYPGLPAHSHDHEFIGNTSTNAYSTPAKLMGRATTCSNKKDFSSYWAPTLYVAGNPVAPLDVTIYYRRLTTEAVKPFPRGLEVVAGNSHALTRQSPAVTQWYCGVLKSSFYGPLSRDSSTSREAAPTLSAAGLPDCKAPTNLELQVNFPNCSNGRATSSDHKSQMAYSRNGRCPASHPIPTPAISIILRYPAVSGSNVFLASGGIYSGHADFMDAWDAPAFSRLVGDCLDRYVACGVAGAPAKDVS